MEDPSIARASLGYLAGEVDVPTVIGEYSKIGCYVRIIRSGDTLTYDVWVPDDLAKNRAAPCEAVLRAFQKVFGSNVLSRGMQAPVWETTIHDMIRDAERSGKNSAVDWQRLPAKVRARFPGKGSGPGIDAIPSVRVVWPEVYPTLKETLEDDWWTTRVVCAIEAAIAEIP